MITISGYASAVEWHNSSFGGSVTVEETSEPSVVTWHNSSFGGSVTVEGPYAPVTVWHSSSFGGSVRVVGYSWGNWSGWWMLEQVSSPVISGIDPSNNSIGNPLSLTWNCTISNPDGNSFNWSIECNNGQSNSSTDDSDGSKNLSLSGLSLSSSYTVWVNVSSNKSISTNEIFYFNTTTGLSASNPYPANNTYNVTSSLHNITVDLVDPEGDTITWSIETSPDIGNSSGITGNATVECVVDGNITAGNISYTWYVNATDGNNTVNETFYFWSEYAVPNVTTNTSTGVGLTNATLHGYLVSDGNDTGTTVFFQYGLTDSYGTNTTENTIQKTSSTYYFDDYLEGFTYTNFNNPDNGVDGSTSTYASDSAGLAKITFNSTTYDNTIGEITSVHIRIHGKIFSADGNGKIILTPSFNGSDGNSHYSNVPIDYTYTGDDGNPSMDWGDYIDITNDSNAPDTWSWYNVSTLGLEAQNHADIGYAGSSTRISKAEVRINYNIISFNQELTGLSNSTTYHYRAAASNTNSTVYGSDMTFTTLPGSVHNFSASNYNSTSINLSWISSTGVDSVFIRYNKYSYPSSRTDGTFLVNESTNTTYNHTGLDLGTSYYYRAWSYNDTSGWGDYNGSVGYTNPGPPIDFQVISTGGTSIGFQVTKGTNATRTVLFMNSTSSGYPNSTNGVEKDNDTGTTLTASGLLTNTTYNFSVYSFNPVSGLWSESNDTVSETTSVTSSEPSNTIANTVNDTRITLSWTKGSDYTVVYRKAGSYPTRSDTEIYNGTLTSYTDTGLTPATHYYYRLYGWNGESSSSGSDTCENITLPSPPVNLSGQISGSTLTITWIKGTGAARTIILNNTANYPSNEIDGTIQYNDTGTTKTVNGVTDINYFAGFSYVVIDGEHLYSLPENMVWGGIEINAYKETDPNVSLTNYTVFITNDDGSETYLNTSATNPFRISVDDVPNGAGSIIQVSKDGYYSRSKVYDLYDNTFYQINFYLPPDSDGSTSGNSGDSDYIPPADETDELQTTSSSVSNPSVNLTITLDCEPSTLVSVQGYNESLYGHWFTIPEDKYTLTSNSLEIDNSILDDNTSMVQAQYYCDEGESYAQQYLITVIDEVDSPISEAEINIKVYINTTDDWETIYILESDGSGESDVYLIPGTLYKFTISKTGYQTEIADYIPSESKYTKEFTLLYEETDPETSYTPNEHVTLTGELSGTDLYVNFSCDWGVISNSQLYVYETDVSTGNETSFYNNSFLVDNEWSEIIGSADSNCSYRVVVHYNHTYWDHQKMTIIINPTYTPPTTETDTDNMFDANYGTNPFGWSNFFLWVFMILLFLYADKEGAGLILIVIGGINLLVSSLLGFNTTIAVVAGGIVPVLFIIVGIMLLWKQYRSVNA